MPRARWKLTQPVPGQPEVDEYGDRLAGDRAPLSLLAELSRDPRSGLEQIQPGVYRSRSEPGKVWP